MLRQTQAPQGPAAVNHWFADSFDLTAGPVEHGPFATEDEARAELASLLGDPAR